MDLSVFDGGSGTEYISYKAQETPHWKIDGVSADMKKFLLEPAQPEDGLGQAGNRRGAALGLGRDRWHDDGEAFEHRHPASDYKAAFQLMVLLNEAHGSPVDGMARVVN